MSATPFTTQRCHVCLFWWGFFMLHIFNHRTSKPCIAWFQPFLALIAKPRICIYFLLFKSKRFLFSQHQPLRLGGIWNHSRFRTDPYFETLLWNQAAYLWYHTIPTPRISKSSMAYGRSHGDIRVIYDGKSEYFRENTIRTYLPSLWRINHDYPGIYLHPEFCIEHNIPAPLSQYLGKALRYLFDHVKELERRRASERLLEKLETSWELSSRGRIKTLQLFETLGTVLATFGCHPEISSPMVLFLTRHIPEIIHWYPENWVNYVGALEDIGIEKRDMRNVLSYVLKKRNLKEGTLLRYRGKLGDDTFHLLCQMIQENKERRQEARLHYERHSRRRLHAIEDEVIVNPHVRGGFMIRNPVPPILDHHKPPRHQLFRIGSPEDEWYHDGYLDDDESYFSNPFEFHDDKIARALEKRRNLPYHHEKHWRPHVFHWTPTGGGFLDTGNTHGRWSRQRIE